MPDPPADLLPELPSLRRVGSVLRAYAATPSTNLLALAAHEDGAVFVADQQTAGRGRRGHSWDSPPGVGLWMSACLQMPPQGLMFAGALAVLRAAEDAPLRLKWPNDILWAGRKVAGVLVEHRAGWSALGIGVNVKQRPADFGPEVRPKAASLAMAVRRPWNRGELLARILLQLDDLVLDLEQGGYDSVFDAWRKACAMEGREVARNGIRGRVASVAADGALMVATPEGLRRLDATPAADHA